MEENKVVETEVVETKEEVVEVIDEKKEKRKKLIKRILIGLAGAGAVIGAGALLLKKDPEVEEYSPEDLEEKGLLEKDYTTKVPFELEPADGDHQNLWRIVGSTQVSETEKIDFLEKTTEG